MRYALLFAGQGTQHADMLPWLESEPASQPALQALAQAVGPDWRGALADPSMRSSNAFAQPLIVATSLAAWAALAPQLPGPPQVVAGYSVGELSAFACAGVLPPQQAIALASLRAARMDAAAAGQAGGLLSVTGLPMAAVLQAFPALDCAIHIAADQGIYAGPADLLDACASALRAQGGSCKRLEVRIASHAPGMAAAAAQFAADLQPVAFAAPGPAIALNASGSLSRQPERLRSALAQQVATTVQWSACLEAVAEQGVDCVLEVGAGSALSTMWSQRFPDIPARALEAFRDCQGAARWVARFAA